MTESEDDGFSMLPISPDLAKLQEIKVMDGDIFVASWPKSGTTWCQAIVAHLIASHKSWTHVSQVTPFFDVENSWQEIQGRLEPSDDIQTYFKKNTRRAWNTHILWSLIPKGNNVKYIYIIRDQKDAVLSFWNHLRNQRGAGGDYQGTIDEFAIALSTNKLPYGSWARHLADWSTAINDQRVLFLRYEDLKENLLDSIRKIAKHIDSSIDPHFVAANTSFEAMRADASRYEPLSVLWKPGFTFLRKGIVGDGASAFSASGTMALEADAAKYKHPADRFLLHHPV